MGSQSLPTLWLVSSVRRNSSPSYGDLGFPWLRHHLQPSEEACETTHPCPAQPLTEENAMVEGQSVVQTTGRKADGGPRSSVDSDYSAKRKGQLSCLSETTLSQVSPGIPKRSDPTLQTSKLLSLA